MRRLRGERCGAGGAWEYRTIDLGRLGYERVEAGEPYREEGIL